MPVRMEPTSAILKDFGLNPGGKIQVEFTKRCADYMDKYVPMREGDLRQYKIDGSKIIYDQPYAQYQYYGLSKSGNLLHYNTDKHELATSYWDVHMWSAEGDKIVQEIQDCIRRK